MHIFPVITIMGLLICVRQETVRVTSLFFFFSITLEGKDKLCLFIYNILLANSHSILRTSNTIHCWQEVEWVIFIFGSIISKELNCKKLWRECLVEVQGSLPDILAVACDEFYFDNLFVLSHTWAVLLIAQWINIALMCSKGCWLGWLQGTVDAVAKILLFNHLMKWLHWSYPGVFVPLHSTTQLSLSSSRSPSFL